MEELIAAAVVGLSFGNSWLCMLFAFGTRGESRATSLYFMLGRLFGTVLLGTVIALIGIIGFSSNILVLTFGILSILFGLFVLRRDIIVGNRIRTLRGKAERNQRAHPGTGCLKRRRHRDMYTKHRRKGFGLALGIFRGATPCLKIMVLAPLLITSPLTLSIAMSLVFALTSSIYPLIGFLAGESLSKFRRWDMPIKAGTVAALFIVGVYYVMKFLVSGDHPMLG